MEFLEQLRTRDACAFGDSEVAWRFADGFHASVGDATGFLRVLSIDAAQARIAIDGTEENVTFAIEGDKVHLARAGQSHTLTDTTHAPPAAAPRPLPTAASSRR